VVVATPDEKGQASRLQGAPGASVAVIPQPVHPPTKPAQQGYLANPAGTLNRY
jgi:hypothetical protein